MSEVACFLIEPTEIARRSFRRYSGVERKCAGRRSYHNAEAIIDELPLPMSPYNGRGYPPDEALRADLRWPSKCESCDYQFAADDEWQVNESRYYRRASGGDGLFRIEDAPPGAMWDSSWWPGCAGPDGKTWSVKLPDGQDWMLDGPARDGGRWTRKGVVPRLTVTPSIATTRYHGFLTDGVLRSC